MYLYHNSVNLQIFTLKSSGLVEHKSWNSSFSVPDSTQRNSHRILSVISHIGRMFCMAWMLNVSYFTEVGDEVTESYLKSGLLTSLPSCATWLRLLWEYIKRLVYSNEPDSTAHFSMNIQTFSDEVRPACHTGRSVEKSDWRDCLAFISRNTCGHTLKFYSGCKFHKLEK